MTIRFHLDESVSLRIVRALRDRVNDVTTPADVGLLSATDEEQLSFAHLDGRVLVAHDDDYIRLHSQMTNHAGIAYCISRSTPLASCSNNCSSSMRATTQRRWLAVWSTCSCDLGRLRRAPRLALRADPKTGFNHRISRPWDAFTQAGHVFCGETGVYNVNCLQEVSYASLVF